MKKILHGVTIVIVVFGALFLINAYWGNPLSRMNAQSETVQYYAAAYKQEFKVYDSEYNPLIPAYIFELGPVNNSNIRFDTGLFCQGITDVYGGILLQRSFLKTLTRFFKTSMTPSIMKSVRLRTPGIVRWRDCGLF